MKAALVMALLWTGLLLSPGAGAQNDPASNDAAEVERLAPDELSRRLPHLETANIAYAALSPGGALMAQMPFFDDDSRMLEIRRTDEGWRVFDVTVEGISYVMTYRNQIGPLVASKGIDQVTRDIREGNIVLEE